MLTFVLVDNLHAIEWFSDDLVVSMFASHAIGHGFKPWRDHTKDHHKSVQTTSLLRRYIRLVVWQGTLTA